jgi:hypothetical protein
MSQTTTQARDRRSPSASHHRPCGCDGHGAGDGGCGDLPELSRLRYFHGQPLGALDLRREQAFHRDRARIHNRLMHGWGIVCGLEVEVAPRPEADDCDPDPTLSEVIVLPGAALDCRGNEIVVRHPRPVYVDRLLDEQDLKALTAEPATVYLTLCFAEVPIDPTRPLLGSGCEPAPACEHARVLDTYRICATLERPDSGPDCEPCCGACGDVCLELAALTDFTPGQPLTQEQVDLSGRRSLALHELTEIVGINWEHGATYSRDDANALLDQGLQVWFSRGVQIASLVPGVVELTGIESGAGRSASTYNIEGEFVDLPATELTTEITYRRTTGETLQYGDRLAVVVRGDFIVDECCRAVDADHLGGAVPQVGDPPWSPVSGSAERVCPPRSSGDGVEGGEFVSWIHVAERGEQR